MSDPTVRPEQPVTQSEPFTLDPSDAAYAGQAVYTPRALRAYDTVVVRLSNRFIWRCPATLVREHYDRHVQAHHLDVGPGTGYYLDRCQFSHSPTITLLDPNPDVLRFTSDRISRYRPTSHAADALKPIDLAAASFGSVALAHVLHCLPGNMDTKAVVFDNVIPLVQAGGVIFGTTILNQQAGHTWVGRKLMEVYNAKGIFTNKEDDPEALDRVLAERFRRYELDVVGSVAVFAAWPEHTSTQR